MEEGGPGLKFISVLITIISISISIGSFAVERFGVSPYYSADTVPGALICPMAVPGASALGSPPFSGSDPLVAGGKGGSLQSMPSMAASEESQHCAVGMGQELGQSQQSAVQRPAVPVRGGQPADATSQHEGEQQRPAAMDDKSAAPSSRAWGMSASCRHFKAQI